MDIHRWKDAITQEKTRTERVTEPQTNEAAAEEKLQEFWGLDLDELSGSSVLAVGGGMGYIHAFNNASRQVSVDPLYGDYQIDPADVQTDVIKGSGERLPIVAGQFDYAFSHHVLEHTFDPISVVNEVFDVLVPGGKYLLQILITPLPNFARHLIAQQDIFGVETAHPHMFSKSEVIRMLKDAGFRLQETYLELAPQTIKPFDMNRPLTSLYLKIKRQKNYAVIATKPEDS